MIHVSVKAEVQEVVKGLEELGLELRGISRKILRALATLTKKRVKKRMGAFVRDRTGMLRANVYGRARSATHAVVAAGYPRVSETLERGGTIVPRKGKYLTFLTDSGWKRMHSVTIPPKRFFSQSAAGFESDPEYQSTIDKVVGKAIQKALKTS